MTLLLSPQFWIVAAIALAVSMFGGCRWQAHNDASNLEAKAHELMVCGFDRDALADAMNQANAIADQAKRDAAAQAVYAVEAVKQADKDRAKYETALGSVEDALERAKRTPTCRAQLEAESCASFN